MEGGKEIEWDRGGGKSRKGRRQNLKKGREKGERRLGSTKKGRKMERRQNEKSSGGERKNEVR